VQPEVQDRVVQYRRQVNPELGAQVAKGLGHGSATGAA
jgi:hypothetical protein